MEPLETELVKALLKKGYSEKQIATVLIHVQSSLSALEDTVAENRKEWMTEEDVLKEKELIKNEFMEKVRDMFSKIPPEEGVKRAGLLSQNMPKLAEAAWENRVKELERDVSAPLRVRGDVAAGIILKLGRRRKVWIEGEPFHPLPPDRKTADGRSVVALVKEKMPEGSGATNQNIGKIIDDIIKNASKRRRRK